MKLRWKEFERRVRRPLRSRIEQSPTDSQEYRRYGWWQKLTQTVHVPGWTLRVLFIPMAAGALAGGLGGSSILVGAILAWVVFSVVWRLGQLTVALRTSPRLLVFGHLPMSDTEIFNQQWKAWLMSTIGSVLDFALLYSLLAVAAGYGSGSPLTGLVLAMAQWLVVLSVAVIFVTYFWNRKFAGPILQLLNLRGARTRLRERIIRAGRLLVVIALVSLLAYRRRSLDGWAVVVPPLGLAHEALGLGRSGSLLVQVWTAFSLGGILMLLPLVYRRLKATYRLPEGLVAGERERGEVEAVRRREISDDAGDPCWEIKATIRRREFLQEASWQRAGWLEGFTARWFTSREQTAAEFLFAGTPSWTRAFKKLLVFGIICAMVWYFVPGVFRAMGSFVWILVIVFAARNNTDFSWPGARARTVSGSSIAMYFLYPIGFWRLTRINLKIRLAHLGLLLVILGVLGTILLFVNEGLNVDVYYYSGPILILVLSLTPLAPLFQISQGTNDATKLRMIALTLLLAGLFIVLTVTMFAVRGGGGYLAGMGLLLTSYGGLLLYGHAYNHGWFDAQRKPQASTSFKLSRSQ